MSNYLEDLEQKPKNKLQKKVKYGVSPDELMTDYDRSYGIQKIFDLHQKKDYKVETLFVAAGIFDRYIYNVGARNFPKSQVCALSTISMLLAAKLE